jgi:hypothetical protein
MHGDDGLEAGSFIAERVDGFMALESGGIEQGHAWDFAS